MIGSLRPWDGYPAAPSPPRLPPYQSTSLLEGSRNSRKDLHPLASSTGRVPISNHGYSSLRGSCSRRLCLSTHASITAHSSPHSSSSWLIEVEIQREILSEAQPQSGRAIGYARAARGTRQTNATISCRRELASCRPRWPSDRPRVRFLPNSIGTSACQSMHSHVVASRLALPTQWPCTGQGCAVRSRDEEPVAGASVHAVVPLVPKPAWPRASLHT